MTQDSPPPVAGPEPERGVGRRFGWPAAAAIGLLCAVVGVLAVVVVASMNKGEGVQAQVIESHGHNTAAVAPASAPLRSGERFATLGLPDGGTYEPKAPNGGTDDYRCFLLDPQLANDATLSGVQVLPGIGNWSITRSCIGSVQRNSRQRRRSMRAAPGAVDLFRWHADSFTCRGWCD